jgi:uncharacterized protein (TIGR02145 family)
MIEFLGFVENKIEEIEIGDQVWMKFNLNISSFRNGEPIKEAKTDEEWEEAGRNKQPAWCYYNNDPANGKKYGKLYNWFAVNDSRGLAPEGWHIPNNKEWTRLMNRFGGESDAGIKLKSTYGWIGNGNGDNESGFTGLPAGYRLDGTLHDVGYIGTWWSSSENDSTSAGARLLTCHNGFATTYHCDKEDGNSVRCLKD